MTAVDERTYKVYKSAYSYKGIQANVKIPTNLVVTDTYDYLIWYVGFTDDDGDQVEAGISYTKKYTGSPQFRKFMNYNGVSLYNAAITSQPSSGDVINIKLVNNGDATASLYIGGYLVTTQTCSGLDKLNKWRVLTYEA